MNENKLEFIGEEVRGDAFSQKLKTSITFEQADASNPFHTKEMRVHGYEHLDLLENRSFTDMMFLLYRGELPDAHEQVLFDKLLGALFNPGVRHPAVRAAMNIAIGRSHPVHILPAGLSVASGDYNGADDVIKCMQFLMRHCDDDVVQVVQGAKQRSGYDQVSQPLLVPGFGSVYGSPDPYAQKLADYLRKHNPDGQFFLFSQQLNRELASVGAGWLMSGLASAILLDLGFTPKQGAGVFQIAISASISAHGTEKCGKPVTDMPFVSDEHYHILKEAR